MRLLIINHFQNAFESLRMSRSRAALTMLGVTIGVASITVILSLTAGATKIITDQVAELGGNIALVRPGATQPTAQIENFTVPLYQSYATSTLTEQDLTAVSQLESVEAAAPLMLIGGTVRSGDNTPSNASVVATLPTLTEIVPFDIRDGQFIDGTTILNTAVVGAQLSIDLFGTEHSIGQTFTVNGQTFTVIGVLKPINNPINYNNIDFDHAAIISLESGKTLNHGVAQLQQINVKAPSKDTLATATKDVANLLTERHGGEKDYSILSGDELSQPSSEFFYILAATLSAIAAISLVVGGIGIMNIMLVSVAERTREIGIRKALGASNVHITWQFLIESMVISLGGGLAGYVLGYGVGFVISRSLLTFDPLFNWHIALATLCISVLVGLLFGLYPALRAARKNPIEALRQYH